MRASLENVSDRPKKDEIKPHPAAVAVGDLDVNSEESGRSAVKEITGKRGP
jgi:DNA topoisomerase VI subunit B